MLKNKINSLFIFIYKIVGFVALIVVCLGILGYLISSVFYFLDRRWIVPLILSPYSKEVIQVSAQYAQQNAVRLKMSTEKMKYEYQLALIDDEININKDFEKRFRLALRNNLRFRQKELMNIQQKMKEYADVKLTASDSYFESALDDVSSLAKAGLIDAETYNQRKFAIDQHALNFNTYKQTERQLKLEKKQLQDIVISLNNLDEKIHNHKVNKHFRDRTVYEVLTVEREHLEIQQNIIKLKNERMLLQEELKNIETSLNKYNEICDKIQRSPYYQAIGKTVIVAFSTYENLKNIKVNDPVYGCYFGLIFCKKIAVVKEILGGEIIAKHPILNKELRGQMIIIDMNDKDSEWAKVKALYVGTKPFLIL
jgi:hypothetical protein